MRKKEKKILNVLLYINIIKQHYYVKSFVL